MGSTENDTLDFVSPESSKKAMIDAMSDDELQNYRELLRLPKGSTPEDIRKAIEKTLSDSEA